MVPQPRALYNRELEKDDKKVLCQLLGKLHLPETVDEGKARTLKTLMQNLRSRRPLRDTTSQNAFSKFEDALSKKYTPQLEGFSEEEYRQHGEDRAPMPKRLTQRLPEDTASSRASSVPSTPSPVDIGEDEEEAEEVEDIL